MAMERVTVEQNGERFSLELPEGTPDDQIQSFLAKQPASARDQLTAPDASLAQPVGQQLAASAIKPALTTSADFVSSAVRNLTPEAVINAVGQPFQTIQQGRQALVNRMPTVNAPVPGTGVGPILAETAPRAATFAEIGKKYITPQNIAKSIGGVGKAVGGALMAPESIMTAPYTMAGYEMEKIRANPAAPEYATNPYAQMTRGEAPTQGAAGAQNRRQAIAGQQYGGLTPEQQQILQQDRLRQEEIQKKKIRAQQVLQQPPTAQNFIERMVAMGDLYGPANQG